MGLLEDDTRGITTHLAEQHGRPMVAPTSIWAQRLAPSAPTASYIITMQRREQAPRSKILTLPNALHHLRHGFAPYPVGATIGRPRCLAICGTIPCLSSSSGAGRRGGNYNDIFILSVSRPCVWVRRQRKGGVFFENSTLTP